MRLVVLILGGALFMVPLATGASAQRGLATSGTLGGQNTIQQAPSGGRVNGGSAASGGSAVSGGTAAQGQPTAEERETEKRNNAATQICKGC